MDLPLISQDGQPIYLTFQYINYAGHKDRRRVQFKGIEFKTTKWHPDWQWIMRAIDLEKGEMHEFAMKDMSHVNLG